MAATSTRTPSAVSAVSAAARPATVDYLKSLIRPHHRFVLIGESSHGTSEQYNLRSDLALALLDGTGVAGGAFQGVVYESDWPPASAANLWVRGYTAGTVGDALQPYRQSRFPTWMWANEEFASFCTRLRALNASLPHAERKGLYGFDVYSFQSSMEKLISFYEEAGDAAGAADARRRYRCFADHGGGDSNRYALSIARGSRGCEAPALAQLVATMDKAAADAEAEARAAEARAAAEAGGGGGGPAGQQPLTAAAVFARERRFDAVCNARAVVHGEQYYRVMAGGRLAESTWNLRDGAMAQTVQAVADHLAGAGAAGAASKGAGGGARLVCFAHDSHVGRAKASEMSIRRGETNVGQLLSEAFGPENVLVVGQTAYAGTVAAARAWGGVVEKRAVRPGLPGSYEALFHQAVVAGAPPTFALDLRRGETANADVRAVLCQPRRVRNIGVIYRSCPAWAEVPSHYMAACMAAPPPEEEGEGEGGDGGPAYGLFDVVIHHDAPGAVTPLDPPPGWGNVVDPDDADVGDED